MLQYAVEEAYHSLLMVGRHPNFDNQRGTGPLYAGRERSPCKGGVKFRDERATFSAVQRAVRSALMAHVPAPVYGSRSAEGWALTGEAGDTTGSLPTPLECFQ